MHHTNDMQMCTKIKKVKYQERGYAAILIHNREEFQVEVTHWTLSLKALALVWDLWETAWYGCVGAVWERPLLPVISFQTMD